MFVCLLIYSADVGGLARHQSGILGGVLSKKSYLAMFAYFNACVLGALLRVNFTLPWASVLPHYRKKHLVVTTLIALLFLGIPMFSVMFVGTSDIALTSVAVIFLTCLAAGLWTLNLPVMGVPALPFLAFVMVPSSSSPALAGFLAGSNPSLSLALLLISLAALGAFAWRLLAMKEDMPAEYYVARLWSGSFRGRGVWAAALPGDKRAALQNFDWLKNPFNNLKQIDSLSGYSERSLWQRLRLWRLGTAPTRVSTSVGQFMAITLIMMPLVMRFFPGRETVVLFSVQIMMNPWLLWLPWFNRRHHLAYESLRPRTRQEFVRELGLALLWDVTLCWLGGLLFMGIATAIWAPELLQVKNIIVFICCTGVGQLCAYAMGIWSSKRGMLALVCCQACAFMAILMWMVWTMNGSISVAVNLAIASVLAAASMASIPLAYRRWCRADLHQEC
jgi:hypothetical protein